MTWLQSNPNDLSRRIELHIARDLQHIAHHALNAVMSKRVIGAGEVIARPNEQVVCQLCQQHQDLLGDKTVFVAVCEMEALLISFVLSFGSAATLIVSSERCE